MGLRVVAVDDIISSYNSPKQALCWRRGGLFVQEGEIQNGGGGGSFLCEIRSKPRKEEGGNWGNIAGPRKGRWFSSGAKTSTIGKQLARINLYDNGFTVFRAARRGGLPSSNIIVRFSFRLAYFPRCLDYSRRDFSLRPQAQARRPPPLTMTLEKEDLLPLRPARDIRAFLD